MKTKLLLLLMTAAVLPLCACTNLPNYTRNEKFVDIRGLSGGYGLIQGMPVKNFASLGLVFTTVEIESSYPTISNVDRSIVADELLKKAQTIGADDIVNVRVYRKDTRDVSTVVKEGIENKTIKHKYEYHGSAMAIKYTGTVLQDGEGGLWIAVDEAGKTVRAIKPANYSTDETPVQTNSSRRVRRQAPAAAAE